MGERGDFSEGNKNKICRRSNRWPRFGGRKANQSCEIFHRGTTSCFYRWEVGGVELGVKVAKQLELGADLGC